MLECQDDEGEEGSVAHGDQREVGLGEPYANEARLPLALGPARVQPVLLSKLETGLGHQERPESDRNGRKSRGSTHSPIRTRFS